MSYTRASLVNKKKSDSIFLPSFIQWKHLQLDFFFGFCIRYKFCFRFCFSFIALKMTVMPMPSEMESDNNCMHMPAIEKFNRFLSINWNGDAYCDAAHRNRIDIELTMMNRHVAAAIVTLCIVMLLVTNGCVYFVFFSLHHHPSSV